MGLPCRFLAVTTSLMAMPSAQLKASSPAPQKVEWETSGRLVPYEEAVAVMEARAAAIALRQASECVWLLEHPAIYTAGTSADPSELLAPGRFPVFKTGRGGRFTYHGPGQRVAYVMLDLSARGRDVRAFVTSLEDWLIATLARFGVEGERHPGQIGIFVDGAKIASIGVRVRSWVSLHGVSLNVDPELEHFSGIVPCGLTDMKVTSLAALGAETDMATVDRALRAAFQRQFVPMTLKPDGGAPPSSVIVTAVTLASGGPSAHRLSMSSTCAAGPENTASTLPSSELRTHPSSPSAPAV
jgi:lipoyl(octanoyl) transferase